MRYIKFKINDSNTKLVYKNSVFSMFGSLSGQLIAMLTSIVMGRIIGATDLGGYSFSMTVSAIAFMFLNFGLSSIYQRDISQNKAISKKILANTLSIKAFITMPTSLVLHSLIFLILKNKVEFAILVLSATYTGFSGVFNILLDSIAAYEDFKTNSIFLISQKIIIFVTTTLSLLTTKNVKIMLLSNNIAFIILILIILLYIDKYLFKVSFEFDFEYVKKYIKEAFPNVINGASEYLSLKSDLIVLSIMLNDYYTGIYSISSNIYVSATLIPLAIAKASTPTFNRMYSEKIDLNIVVKKTIFAMFAISVPIVILILYLSDLVIPLLWGNDFILSSELLKILSIGLLIMPFNRLLGYYLVGLKEQNKVMISTTIGAVINIILNILLLPKIGCTAVAYTTIITEFIVLSLDLVSNSSGK